MYKYDKKFLRNEKGMTLVVGLMIIMVLTLLGATAVMTTTTDLKITGNYRTNEIALYNAEAGVDLVMAYVKSHSITYPTANATVTTINTNPGCTNITTQCTQISLTAPTGFSFSDFYNHTAGNSSVRIYGKDVAKKLYVFRMTGIGPNNASKTIEAYIITKVLPFGIDGAIGMYGENPTIQSSGVGFIDGHDYSLPPTNCAGNSCHTAADGLGADLAGLYSNENVDTTGANILGNPAQVLDTSAAGLAKDDQWTEFADSLINSGLYDSTLSSNRAAPKVTIISSDKKISGNEHYYGIMVVTGTDVEIETVGTMTFEGLIILANGATLTTKGTANIYGSVVTCNHSELTVTLKGTPYLMYSSAAIANLNNLAATTVQKNAWREVF